MRTAFVLTVLTALTALPAAGQVGHPPRSSPYHEILNGHSVTPVAGYFAGSGGRFGIGAHNGVVYGVRYDLRTGKTLQFGFSVAQGDLDRFIVDPVKRKDNRITGPLDQRTRFADVSAQLNVSGGKSWRGLAPYAGLSLGVAFGSDLAADTSGYEFGNKFYFAPHLGTRVFVGSRVHLRAEVRAAFWKLDYPERFGQEPVEDPGTPPDNSNAVITDGRFDEWTANPWFQLGLGYAFRF